MRSVIWALGIICCTSSLAWADAGSSYPLAQVETPLPIPAVRYYAPTPVRYAPPVSYTATYAPPVGYSPSAYPAAPPVGYGAQVSYYAPAAPVSTYYAPTAPVSTYYPPAVPVTTYYAPVAPTVVYRPVAPAYPAPVFVGRPAIVRQHLYIPGQPVRNALRVLLP